MFRYKAHGNPTFPNMSVAYDVLTAYSVDIIPLYIGVRLRVLPLLLFHKAFCLLQFRFSCAFANFSFKGIIGGPLTTFNFPVSFFKLRLYCPCCIFYVSVCGVF